MNKEETRKIFEEVKENTLKLNNCKRPHNFEPLPKETRRVLDQKWKCVNCGGIIKNLDHHWFMKGYEDGKLALCLILCSQGMQVCTVCPETDCCDNPNKNGE